MADAGPRYRTQVEPASGRAPYARRPAPAPNAPAVSLRKAPNAPLAPGASSSRRRAQASQIAVEVVGRDESAQDAVTLWLAQPGTKRAPAPYLAGQFVTLALPGPHGETLYRSYSLCGDGRAETPWEITIKRQEGGQASNYLADDVRPGAILHASPPLGHFTLPAQVTAGMTFVFVTTGSGITPIMGLLRALAHVAPSLHIRAQLHYAYHSPADAIYGRALDALDPHGRWLRQWRYISTEGHHRLTVEGVVATAGELTPTSHWYICGSSRLRRKLEALLPQLGLPPAQFHAESFGDMRRESSAALAVPRRATGEVNIRLAESGAVVIARPHETLLAALERNDIHPPFNCRVGVCGTCRVRLLAGQVSRGEESGLTAEQRAQGDTLACVAYPLTDVTLAGVDAAAPAPRLGRVTTNILVGLTLVGVLAILIASYHFAQVSPSYFVLRLIEAIILGGSDLGGLVVSVLVLRALGLPARLITWGVGVLIAAVGVLLCARLLLHSTATARGSVTFSNALGILGAFIAVYAINQWTARQGYALIQRRLSPAFAQVVPLWQQTLVFLREQHQFFGWLVLVAGTAHAVLLFPMLSHYSTRKVITGVISLVALALLVGMGEWITYATRKSHHAGAIRLLHALLSLLFLVAVVMHAFIFPNL